MIFGAKTNQAHVKALRKTVQNMLGDTSYSHNTLKCEMCYHWYQTFGVFCPGYYAIELKIDATGEITETDITTVQLSIMASRREAQLRTWHALNKERTGK